MKKRPLEILIVSPDLAAAERLAVKAAGNGCRSRRVFEFGTTAYRAALDGVDACVIDLGLMADAALNLAETLAKSGTAPPIIFVGYAFLKDVDDRHRAEALGRIPPGDDFIAALSRARS